MLKPPPHFLLNGRLSSDTSLKVSCKKNSKNCLVFVVFVILMKIRGNKIIANYVEIIGCIGINKEIDMSMTNTYHGEPKSMSKVGMETVCD